MLEKWINHSTITLLDKVNDWQQALKVCARPLLASGTIADEYVAAIISQHQRLGPYYVLAPGLAMPHARPEEGARASGLSLLKLGHGVAFGAEEYDPVDLIIMLAAPDRHSHIDMISALAELLSCESELEKLHQATSMEEIKAIIQRF